MTFIAHAARSFCLFVMALALPAAADGVYPLHDVSGAYLGDVEIYGDVIDQNGTPYAEFQMTSLGLVFYIPPEAAYVEMSQSNPILRGRTPFYGFWVGYRPEQSGPWQTCSRGVKVDPNGHRYGLWGDLRWTNSMTPDGDLAFTVDLGRCGDQIRPWARHQPTPVAAPRPSYVPRRLSVVQDVCGNASDLAMRADGCSEVIAHPEATLDDVSGAFWTRAYVRCGGLASDLEVMSDLMAAVRLDTATWQQYYARIGFYSGPVDGRIGPALVAAVNSYVKDGCR